MTGPQLKDFLQGRNIVLVDVANALHMSKQTLFAALSVKDVKTGLIEELSEILNIPVWEFFGAPGPANNVQVGDNSAAAVGAQSTATAGNDKTVELLLKELAAQREQNARLVELLTRK